jgi:hypothetical protein
MRLTCRFSARTLPIRATIVGRQSVAARINASMATRYCVLVLGLAPRDVPASVPQGGKLAALVVA